MATFYDALQLTYLGPVFSFVFMAIIVFAICLYIPVLHGKKVVAAILGIVVAGLMLLSPTATGMVMYMAPWFAVVLFLLFMLSMLAQSFGGEGHGGGMAMSGAGGLAAVFIVGILVIGAVNYLRDTVLYPDTVQDGSIRPALIFFNPMVLGALVLLAIAACAIALLTGSGGH